MNPGFEEVDWEQAVGWFATGGGWGVGPISATSEAARTGNVGAKIAGAAGWVYQVIPVEPEASYRLSVWTKGDGSGQLKFEWLCRDPEPGEEDIGCSDSWKSLTAGSEWQEVTVDTTASLRANAVRIMLRHTTGEERYIYYDDVSFKKVVD